jgi:hypothetical protein
MRYFLALVLCAGSLSAQLTKPYSVNVLKSDVSRTTFTVVTTSRVAFVDGTVMHSTAGFGGSGGGTFMSNPSTGILNMGGFGIVNGSTLLGSFFSAVSTGAVVYGDATINGSINSNWLTTRATGTYVYSGVIYNHLGPISLYAHNQINNEAGAGGAINNRVAGTNRFWCTDGAGNWSNQNLLPATNGTLYLGSSSNRWLNISANTIEGLYFTVVSTAVHCYVPLRVNTIIWGDGTTSTTSASGGGGTSASTFTYVEQSLFAGAATPNDINPALVWKYNTVANTSTHAAYGVYFTAGSTVSVSYDITVPMGYYGDGASIYIIGATTGTNTGNVGWTLLISTVQTFGTTDVAYQTATVAAVNYASQYVLYKSTYDAKAIFTADMAGREAKMVVSRDISVAGLVDAATMKKLVIRFKVKLGD